MASPYLTIVSLKNAVGMVLPHMKASLIAFILGFLLAVTMGMGFGLIIGTTRYLNKCLSPLIPIGLTIPKVTLLPLFILWFGIGRSTVIIYAMIAGFFPMIINTISGVVEVKPIYIVYARSMGYSNFQIYRKVIFPAMLPVITSGLFLSSVLTLMGVFVVEMAFFRIGLGALINDLAVAFRTGELYAVILITAIISFIINGTFWYISRRFNKWRD
jgi:ABC-type nitrate/sulfonate/bicarbonate transport system permease component